MALGKKYYDIFKFFGLFATSIVINYFAPSLIKTLWFFGLLAAFFFAKSKHNYFWIVFFWLVFAAPGYLFYSRGVYHLPVIPVSGLGREVFYSELFAIFAVSKAMLYPVKQTVFYHRPLAVLIFYSVFLLILGFLYGMGLLTFLKSIRFFIPILLLPAIPCLLPRNSIPRTIFLMFFCVIILLPAQLFDVVFGFPLAAVLGETRIMFSGMEVGDDFAAFDVSRRAVRTVYGPFILLFSVILGLIYLLPQNKKLIKPWFVYFTPLLAAFSIFLSATRGWIVGISVVFMGFGIIQTKDFSKYALTSFFILALLFSVPQLNKQITQVWERVTTLKTMVEGDLTADGTLVRVTERSPRVMNKFWERPLFGFGFSDDYYEYADSHVGNQTLLLNGGIVGYLIFLYFIGFFLWKFFNRYLFSKQKEMLIFLFGLIALLAIHSSSRMVFGYATNVQTSIALGLYFFFSDYYFNKHNQN